MYRAFWAHLRKGRFVVALRQDPVYVAPLMRVENAVYRMQNGEPTVFAALHIWGQTIDALPDGLVEVEPDQLQGWSVLYIDGDKVYCEETN